MTRLLEILDPAVVAETTGLRVIPPSPPHGRSAGPYRSRLSGGPVEFAQHRVYSRGDDLRFVDWKLYARSDRFFVRRNVDDSNLQVLAVVDCSRSMVFCSTDRVPSKLDFACRLAAGAVWIAARDHNAVGLATFSDSMVDCLPPGRSEAQLDAIADMLMAARPLGETDYSTVLAEVSGRFRQPLLLIFISDFLDGSHSLQAGLAQCRAAGHDAFVWQIVDPAEQDWLFDDTTEFNGLESSYRAVIEPDSIKQEYRDEFARHVRDVEALCATNGVRYGFGRTDEPMCNLIARLLSSPRAAAVATTAGNRVAER